MRINHQNIPLPIPDHFDEKTVGDVWRIPYQSHLTVAREWSEKNRISPAFEDNIRTCLLLIDVQNTFCIPDYELFVAGRSGNGAVEDNVRLCQFIYHNLQSITQIACTLDTHTTMQIFHEVFWIDDAGNHPTPLQTLITQEDIEAGNWRVNPAIADNLYRDSDKFNGLETYVNHYVKTLTTEGKYPLTIWPYHAMLGGIGHAVVSAVDEACFFHAIVRHCQTHYELKGQNPLTENYSVLRPEVLQDEHGKPIAQKNNEFLQMLLGYDRLIIAGQAKSHCVAWTISDLLQEIQQTDTSLAEKVYLVEDLTSPVVVPDIVDFTDAADAAFAKFSDAGMHIVKSTDLIDHWV